MSLHPQAQCIALMSNPPLEQQAQADHGSKAGQQHNHIKAC